MDSTVASPLLRKSDSSSVRSGFCKLYTFLNVLIFQDVVIFTFVEDMKFFPNCWFLWKITPRISGSASTPNWVVLPKSSPNETASNCTSSATYLRTGRYARSSAQAKATAKPRLRLFCLAVWLGAFSGSPSPPRAQTSRGLRIENHDQFAPMIDFP